MCSLVRSARHDASCLCGCLSTLLTKPYPHSCVLVGSADTLAARPGADVRGDLIGFAERIYSSHLMKLVFVGREPFDVLEDWVRT